jgi:hypothetical protein
MESQMSVVIEKTFNVSSTAILLVDNIRGSVEIRPGKEGVIQVTATKQTHTGDEKRTQIEITQEADGSVKAATRFPDSGWNWLSGTQPCEVDYIVNAPHQCSLKFNGVSSQVLAEGLEGNCSVNTISGEVTLRNMNGSFQIHSVSGDTNGERISGSLDLDTVSGDLAWNDATLSSIRTKTISGDVKIQTSMTKGPYAFKSVSGDVCLTMPPHTQFSADLHSVSGNLVSTFPIEGASHHHGTQTIRAQGGGVNISLHSVSGDLSLKCDREISSSPELKEKNEDKDHLVVLEKLEKGALTVEEALSLLVEKGPLIPGIPT